MSLIKLTHLIMAYIGLIILPPNSFGHGKVKKISISLILVFIGFLTVSLIPHVIKEKLTGY